MPRGDVFAGVDGMETVIAGFWKVKGSTAAKAEQALKKAAAFLLEQSQELVPVEFGDLRASGFIRWEGGGFKTKVTIGYSASYALAVHEKIEMKLKGQLRRPSPPHIGRYWDPAGQATAKFLEKPARELQPEMRQMIYAEFL